MSVYELGLLVIADHLIGVWQIIHHQLVTNSENSGRKFEFHMNFSSYSSSDTSHIELSSHTVSPKTTDIWRALYFTFRKFVFLHLLNFGKG